MKLRIFFFAIFSIFIAISTNAQTIKKFSDDQQIFLEELTNFFKEVDNPDDKKIAKEFIEMFTLEWNGGKFNADEKKLMIATCNKMLKKKMKNIPHFRNYLTTIISFKNTNQTEASYKAWEASLDKLINRSTSSLFIDYLEISNNLFTENILYKSSTTIWKSNNSNYIFEYDTVPRIVFPSLDFTCLANNDSAKIYNTKGVYYPTTQIWKGNGGTVTWKRAGLEENAVYAQLSKYSINLKYSKYTADSVNFYNINYFSSPLLGVLEEKVLANMTPEKATYPRFDSYDKRLKIKNIFTGVDYDGGFSMSGAKLLGAGDDKQDAYFTFYREGKEFVKTGAKNYIIRKDKISSEDASVAIYWEEDSIYHPGLQMKYLNDKRELSFIRSNQGIAKTPFFDTYHKLDMYVEVMNWKLDEPIIKMSTIKGTGIEGEADFESYNYYSEARYYKIMGIDETHPLSDLRKYAKLKDTNIVYVPDYAKSRNIDLSQIQAQMITLANLGFVSYDIDKDKVYIKEKLGNFLLSRVGKIDYDVIQFNSVTTSEVNASINLLNFDLKLNGVKVVHLSDSQNVRIYPTDQKLIVKKNRDFDFEGRVHAGLFDFYGKLFSFNYLKFNIDMPVVDSLVFYVRSFKPNDKGVYTKEKVKSVIEGIKGDLQIDESNNKSGLKSIAKYPLFTSQKDSYVYYDKKPIWGGVYTRDRFYFHIDPFVIDSLDDITTEGIGFDGNFVSADIFPDFDESLKVQPDYSLGFVRLTPEGGFQAYKGKGIFDSIVDLSNKGLRGNGTLKYLTSVSKSNNFIFFPDSMNADVQNFELVEVKSGTEYPPVIGQDVYEHWMPYNDLMTITKKQKPIEMYNNEAVMNGSLYLTPKNLTGSGMMVFSDAEMDSKLFKYKNRVFDADTADFRLRSYDLSALAFSTYNYKSHIDFDARKGEFKSNGGGSKVDFPINKYICYMDEFDWYMDKEEIDLVNSKSNRTEQLNKLSLEELADLDLSGSEFVSVHPQQDSLRFFSPRAKYNLRESIIYAKDVKLIKVADAAIFPGDGNVTIFKDAEMKTLTDAKILANTASKYHTIYDADIKITAKNNYTATGMYDYVTSDTALYPIYFNKIGVDTAIQTFADGAISDTSKFQLSSEFDYAGGVHLTASNRFLTFNGAFNITHDCDTAYRSWVKFKSDVNPNDIFIPIGDTIYDINGKKLDAGIMLANDSNEVYAVFLSKKHKTTDQEVIQAKGYISYDKTSDEYRISNKEKIKQINQPGNYISLTRLTCVAYGDGKIELAPNSGRVTVGAYGNAKQIIIPDSTDLDLVISLDFFFNDNALKIMNERLEKYTKLKGYDLSKPTFTRALTEIYGTKEADKLISDISMNGSFKKLPPELIHTFLLGDVKMKWNHSTKSFVSEGPLAIIAINKNQVNKYVDGYIEVKKSRTGDEINIYFEFDSTDWYYFNYKTNTMQAISSNTEFNTSIKETKPDNQQLKSEKDLPAYKYTISTESKKKSFVSRVSNK